MWTREHFFGTTMIQAAGLLAQRGYDNVRAEELARVARVSVGTLYRQYGSKRGFALSVRDFAEREICHVASIEFEFAKCRHGGFRAGFFAFWQMLARAALSQPSLFCFTFLHWHPEDVPEEERGWRVRQLVREVLAEGERQGALVAGSAAIRACLIWGSLAELARVATQRSDELTEEDVYASAEALWRALGPAEDPGPRGPGGGHPSGEDESRDATARGDVALPYSESEAEAPSSDSAMPSHEDPGSLEARRFPSRELQLGATAPGQDLAAPSSEEPGTPGAKDSGLQRDGGHLSCASRGQRGEHHHSGRDEEDERGMRGDAMEHRGQGPTAASNSIRKDGALLRMAGGCRPGNAPYGCRSRRRRASGSSPRGRAPRWACPSSSCVARIS